MNLVCGWCNVEMCESPDTDSDDRATSHSICSACTLDFTRGTGLDFEEMLDLVSEPVLVVDHAGVVHHGNRAAHEILEAGTDNPMRELGDVLECAHAAKPGGCGRTAHCVTCTARILIADTLTSGPGRQTEPIKQTIATANGQRTVISILSSERIGDRILLRIDKTDRTS